VEAEKESEDEFCETCFHCGTSVPVADLRSHVRQCSQG